MRHKDGWSAASTIGAKATGQITPSTTTSEHADASAVGHCRGVDWRDTCFNAALHGAMLAVAMDVRQVNLNLLIALNALLAHRNVTRAATQMGLTQSAMSGELRRLRALFSDELL